MNHKHKIKSNNNSTNVRFRVPALLYNSMALLSRVAPPMASRAAAELFCRTQKGTRNTDELKLLDQATPFTITAEGHKLAAWSWGTGPVVLLHHGWCGRGTQLGSFVGPLVENGFRVVTYDAPAHGDSPGRITNGFEMGRICHQVVDSFGGIEAIIGHSLGCSVGAFAMRTGAQIKRAVFVNPPAEMDTYAELFRQALGLTDNVIDGMKARFEAGSTLRWFDFKPENLARGQSAELLVFADRNDRKAPWRGGQAIAEAWADGQFVLTEGLGHSRILADKEVITRVINFLSI